MTEVEMEYESEKYNLAIEKYKAGDLDGSIKLLGELSKEGFASGDFGLAMTDGRLPHHPPSKYYEMVEIAANKGFPQAVYYHNGYLFEADKISFLAFLRIALKQAVIVNFRRLAYGKRFNQFFSSGGEKKKKS